MLDDDVRSSCFAALEVLCAKHGMEVPYVGGLDQGFAFRGRRVPFLNYQKGIYRAAAQRGPAALSTAKASPQKKESPHTVAACGRPSGDDARKAECS